MNRVGGRARAPIHPDGHDVPLRVAGDLPRDDLAGGINLAPDADAPRLILPGPWREQEALALAQRVERRIPRERLGAGFVVDRDAGVVGKVTAAAPLHPVFVQ